MKPLHVLQTLALFNHLSDDDLRKVSEMTFIRTYAKKTPIFTEGADKQAVYLVLSGQIKTFKTDANGHEQIISFLRKGDLFPHVDLFTRLPYPATATAILPARLLAIPIPALEQMIHQYPSVSIRLIELMGNKLKDMQQQLQSLVRQDVSERWRSLLLRLVEQYGKWDECTGMVELNVPISKQDLAGAIGSTRETISRLIHQMQKDGLLRIQGKTLFIPNIQQLQYPSNTHYLSSSSSTSSSSDITSIPH